MTASCPPDLVVSAPFQPEVMFEEILSDYIDSMDNLDIKNITEKLFRENEGKLLYYPAAKRNHHSIRSGLLYHVLTMLNILPNEKGLVQIWSYPTTMNRSMVLR